MTCQPSALPATTKWVESISALGAVEVGFKICLAEGGKWRTVRPIAEAVEFLAGSVSPGDSVEAWGLDAQGEFVGEVW